MRFKLIACNVLSREIGLIAASSPHFVDITYLRQGYHDTPEELRRVLQAEIDAIDAGNSPYTCLTKNGEFDAILLGYGLCCNGTVGVTSQKYPLVIPRAHDCITFLLGSKETYAAYFEQYPGTFWYTPGWCENIETRSARRARLTADYTERYGEENAAYLVEMECSWQKDYQNIIYIRWDKFPFPDFSAYPKALAAETNLAYRCISGESGLLEDFLNGSWDDARFLLVPPKRSMEPTYDSQIMGLSPQTP